MVLRKAEYSMVSDSSMAGSTLERKVVGMVGGMASDKVADTA